MIFKKSSLIFQVCVEHLQNWPFKACALDRGGNQSKGRANSNETLSTWNAKSQKLMKQSLRTKPYQDDINFMSPTVANVTSV